MYFESLENSKYLVDLHLHSYYSDGTETPSEIVHKAREAGVRVLAITDHDCVLGIDEAINAATYSMTIIPAIEFSIGEDTQRGYPDLHILGYGIRHHEPILQSLLKRTYEGRLQQKIHQIERLQTTYHLHVPVDDVLARAHGVPTQLHIAQVALMHNSRLFSSIQDVFDQYLVANAPYPSYVPRTFELCAEDAIELIHEVGGVAVLAHPGLYTEVTRMDNVIYRLAQAGLDGLEVRYTYAKNRGFYRSSDPMVEKLVAHFDSLADELDLLKTAGSDYHGTAKPNIVLGEAGLTLSEWQALQAVIPHRDRFYALQ